MNDQLEKLENLIGLSFFIFERNVFVRTYIILIINTFYIKLDFSDQCKISRYVEYCVEKNNTYRILHTTLVYEVGMMLW